MARERRKWTTEEDMVLRAAVEEAIEANRPLLWREISKSIPGRSNKDCRRRWCNSLATTLSKGPWTESEDERLWDAVQKHSARWAEVSQEVRTRNPDQCSSHWNQALNPNINYSDWTPQDDENLKRSVAQYGSNWSTIASLYFPNRTQLAIRNRFNALTAKHRHNRNNKSRSSSHRREGVRNTSTPSTTPRNNYNPRLLNSTLEEHGYNDGGDENDNEDDNDDDEDDDDDDNDDEEDAPWEDLVEDRRYMHRPAAPNELWLKRKREVSHPQHTNAAASSSMAYADGFPSHTYHMGSSPAHSTHQTVPFSSAPYGMQGMDAYPEPPGWNSIMAAMGPAEPSGLLQDLEKLPNGESPMMLTDGDNSNKMSDFYPPPFSQITPPSEPSQPGEIKHCISIEVECTAQEVPQIMNTVLAINGKITMRLNHSSSDPAG